MDKAKKPITGQPYNRHFLKLNLFDTKMMSIRPNTMNTPSTTLLSLIYIGNVKTTAYKSQILYLNTVFKTTSIL